jgi:phosphoglycerate dehydrogenase-like enzyme
MANKYKIVLTDFFAPDSVKIIERYVPPGFDFVATRSKSRPEMLKLITDADFFIASGAWGTDTEMIKAAPKLKFVQKWGVGVDKFDFGALRAAGIPLAITAGGNSTPVAEHTLGFMVAAAKRFVAADRATRSGRYLRTEMEMSSVQICQKVIGIVGLGNIGKKVAKRVLGFEPAEVLYRDIVPQEKMEKELGIHPVSLDELLQRSDFVTLHVPLNETTRKMIGAREIGLMKKTAILINTCRGGVVDEEALYEALRDHRLLGAAVDVFEKEPAMADHPLFTLDNIIVTSHMAHASVDNIPNMAQHCFRNIVRFAEGKPLPEEDVIIPAATPVIAQQA